MEQKERLRENIKAFLRLIIILGVLWLLRTMLLILPGINNPIFNTSITSFMVINVVIGVLMIFTVLKFEREINKPVKILQESSMELQTVIKCFIYLIVIGIAYSSFYPLVDGILPEYVWIFALILLVIAFFPLARIAVGFYYGIDKWVDFLSKKLVKTKQELTENASKCPSCGAFLISDDIYCNKCGSKTK